MTDIVEFLTARLDEDKAAAEAAQAVDPGPWTVEVVEGWRGREANTNWRPGHGAAYVDAADGNPLWEPNSYTSAEGEQCMTVSTARHAARHDPARVLREVAAKRAIVALHEPEYVETINPDRDEISGEVCTLCDEPFPCDTLKLLAAPDGDHQNFSPTWRVNET